MLATAFSTTAFAQNYNDYDRSDRNGRVERNDRQDYNKQVIPATETPIQYFVDYGTVKKIAAEYQKVNKPREVCSDEIIQERVTSNPQQNYGGAALGGVIGGLAGNQVGSGSGRAAATAAGAIAGAFIGDGVSNRNARPVQQYQERRVQNCRQVENIENVFMGYRVTYEYKGQVNNFLTSTKPVGNRVKLRGQVSPEY